MTTAAGRSSPSEDATDPRVSVIVPTRNGGSHVRELLDALSHQTLSRQSYEVIIADDGSTDGSTEALSNEGRVRKSPGPPLNSYAARNRAAATSRAPVLAFCDIDCRPEPDWLEAGLAALAGADLVAGLVRFALPRRPTIASLLDIHMFLDQEEAVRQKRAVTANLFVRREIFESVAGFDATLAAGGDADLVARCVAAGARLRFSRDAAVSHPTIDSLHGLVRKVWRVHKSQGAREGRRGARLNLLRLNLWLPMVKRIRRRRRQGLPLALDARRLAENGARATRVQNAAALPLLYVLIPYVAAAARCRGLFDERRRTRKRAELLLVCSSGGHLLQLVALRPAWHDFGRVWVTFDKSDARSLLADEEVVYAHAPTNRNVKNLLRNLVLAWRVISELRPKAIVTTGAGVAVPFAWVGRLRGADVVYIESLARVRDVSLSCRLIAPLAARVYVQSPDLVEAVPRARYAGTVFADA